MMGSVCQTKHIKTGSRNFLEDMQKLQIMVDHVQKWLRQQSKDLCYRFRHTDKAMVQVDQS
jgi:hypothetical protein